MYISDPHHYPLKGFANMRRIQKFVATTLCVLLLLACVSPVLAHHDMAAHGQTIITKGEMGFPTKEAISKIDASTKTPSKDTPTPDAYKVLWYSIFPLRISSLKIPASIDSVQRNIPVFLRSLER